MAELLLDKGYEVHGIIRRASTFNTGRIQHLYANRRPDGRGVQLHYGDLTDFACLLKIIAQCQPDEIYNLGAQSDVKVGLHHILYIKKPYF